MIQRAWGRVESIREEYPDIQRLTVRVKGQGDELWPALCFPDLTGRAAPGDWVLLNTTACRLGLGSGGFHFVMACVPPASRPLADAEAEESPGEGPAAPPDAWAAATAPQGLPPGHIMKMRYTPLQRAVLAVDEEASPHRAAMLAARDLGGQPVVIGSVHSHLAPAVAGLRRHKPQARVAYLMTDGAALPAALSETVRRLRAGNHLCGCITSGHAFGGDLEAVNIYSGLLAARHVLKADVTIAVMGPGVVGTASPLGHTGVEVAQLVDAVSALGGRPIVIPRLSGADPRSRHRGISHHTLTALGRLTHTPCTVALPRIDDPVLWQQIHQQLHRWGLPRRHRLAFWRDEPLLADLPGEWQQLLRSMGRDYHDDAVFFEAAAVAGWLAGQGWEAAVPPVPGPSPSSSR